MFPTSTNKKHVGEPVSKELLSGTPNTSFEKYKAKKVFNEGIDIGQLSSGLSKYEKVSIILQNMI